MARRIAIVGIHGVAPHARYDFQDQVSELLTDRLNERGDAKWVIDIVNPHQGDKDVDEPLPTISRLRQADDDAANPKRDTIDVIEAYWSPIDKGRARWYGVLQWILRAVFTPLNTTARVAASWQKQVFDYAYIGGSVVLAFVLFGISLSAVWQSMLNLLTITGLLNENNPAATFHALNQNVETTAGVPIKMVVWLGIGVVGAYLVTQAMTGVAYTIMQTKSLLADRAAFWHRMLAIAVLTTIGATLVVQMALVRFPHGILGWRGVAFLVLIFTAFNLGRALLTNFLTDFFGDVQIYCTKDENSNLFRLRQRIIDVAVHTLRRALCPELNGGIAYDSVIVLAHSLGATVAMDAVVQLYQLCEQEVLSDESFARLRAFITLGASLEKTRYFFDVSTTKHTMTFSQWRNDLYGALFTQDVNALTGPNQRPHAVFWANYWYFQDPICNEITSYRGLPRNSSSTAQSTQLADARAARQGPTSVICRNERGTKSMSLFHPLLHGDYLYDDWFWDSDGKGHLGMLEVLDRVLEAAHLSRPRKVASGRS